MPEVTQWQSIETAPQGECEVLLYGGDLLGIDIGYRFWANCPGFICRQDEYHNGHDCAPISRNPTHWMPLPPPPGE